MAASALLVSACGSNTAQVPKNAAYVALGDSYTAFPGASSQINAACYRDSQNYPHLVAAALHYSLADMSCSGAKTSDFTSSQKSGVPAQFAALGAKTRLVTVSIGANNNKLSGVWLGGCTLLRNVPAAGNNPCEMQTFTRVTQYLTELKPTLIATYQAIKAKAPNAKVIVVGYPQVLGNSGTCAKFPLASGDVAYVNAINTQLNNAIQAAAQAAGVDYLDIATASADHGICSSDPWINGMTTIPGEALAVHPFANEEQAVARMLEQKLKG